MNERILDCKVLSSGMQNQDEERIIVAAGRIPELELARRIICKKARGLAAWEIAQKIRLLSQK